tara:strand:- start:554 stop:1033 length:480 start_codon:yes stop_codon:yes gene_type:complete
LKIKNNFLPVKEFNDLKKLVFSNEFGWFYRQHQVEEYKDQPYLCHSVISHGIVNSPFYESHFKCLLRELNANICSEIRVNLMVRDIERYKSAYHKDRPYECKTAIFYINSNDGYTQFKKTNKKVLSEENKILIFNSQEQHRAVSPINIFARCVVNINYV